MGPRQPHPTPGQHFQGHSTGMNARPLSRILRFHSPPGGPYFQKAFTKACKNRIPCRHSKCEIVEIERPPRGIGWCVGKICYSLTLCPWRAGQSPQIVDLRTPSENRAPQLTPLECAPKCKHRTSPRNLYVVPQTLYISSVFYFYFIWILLLLYFIFIVIFISIS